MQKIFSARQIDRLQGLLVPGVTALTASSYDAPKWFLLEPTDPALERLGVTVAGGCRVALTSLETKLGNVRIRSLTKSGLVVLDNRAWSGTLVINLWSAASDAVAIFNLSGRGTINLPNVFMRSPDQLFFWGQGGTSVETKVEIEGNGRSVVVGDDALFSSGIRLQNFDMHAIVDLQSLKQLNTPADVVIEKHVWLGEGALVLACPLVGAGSIVGAKALVKKPVPRKVAIAGIPGRVLRTNVSWGRSASGMMPEELELISSLDHHDASAASDPSAATATPPASADEHTAPLATDPADVLP